MTPMEKDQIKQFVAAKVAEGLSLSQILGLLMEQKVRMTFLELRLLASELENVDWSKTDKPEAKESAPKELDKSAQGDAMDEELPPEDEALMADDAAPEGEAPAAAGEAPKQEGPRGVTKVEVHKLVKPGFLACGSVKFGSGASAEWFVDQYGRLGLDKATGKPDKQDVEEFQAELQKIFAQQGL